MEYACAAVPILRIEQSNSFREEAACVSAGGGVYESHCLAGGQKFKEFVGSNFAADDLLS